MSEAQLIHAEKMKRGEIEYSGKIIENQKSDWKDEFVLLVISSPLFLLAWSVFAEDEKMQQKIDLYFEKLQEMPWWIVGLWVSVVAAIYGLKATDVISMNKNK
jgi:surface polysaccharide O-acyltransferase-like enzyme